MPRRVGGPRGWVVVVGVREPELEGVVGELISVVAAAAVNGCIG